MHVGLCWIIRHQADACDRYLCALVVRGQLHSFFSYVDVVDGFELRKNTNGNPVTAEPFSLQCGVSLYSYTANMTWFYTSPAGITKRIVNSTVLPGGVVVHLMMSWV